MPNNNQKISIIIPAYNESNRITDSMKKVHEFVLLNPNIIEVIWVIEKSQDNTAELAKKIALNIPLFQVIENEIHLGKGHAVRQGMLYAKGDLLFFMDLDLSTDLKAIREFIQHFNTHSNTQIIIGNRRHEDSVIVERQNIFRVLMGRIFNVILRLIGLSDIKDTQCGFKAFRRQSGRTLFGLQKLNGFTFDVEILLLANMFHYKVESMPVEWKNSAESKVRLIQDSMMMFLEIIKIRLFLYFNLRIKKQAKEIASIHQVDEGVI